MDGHVASPVWDGPQDSPGHHAEAAEAQLFSPSAPRPSTSPSASDASEVFFSPSESLPDPESPLRALARETVQMSSQNSTGYTLRL